MWSAYRPRITNTSLLWRPIINMRFLRGLYYHRRIDYYVLPARGEAVSYLIIGAIFPNSISIDLPRLIVQPYFFLALVATNRSFLWLRPLKNSRIGFYGYSLFRANACGILRLEGRTLLSLLYLRSTPICIGRVHSKNEKNSPFSNFDK